MVLSTPTPLFSTSVNLQNLILAHVIFSGELLGSIGTLDFLLYIDIISCYFPRQLPSSLVNLQNSNTFTSKTTKFLEKPLLLWPTLPNSQSCHSPIIVLVVGLLSGLCKQTKLTGLDLTYIISWKSDPAYFLEAL